MGVALFLGSPLFDSMKLNLLALTTTALLTILCSSAAFAQTTSYSWRDGQSNGHWSWDTSQWVSVILSAIALAVFSRRKSILSSLKKPRNPAAP
jgi:hypothetical protein